MLNTSNPKYSTQDKDTKLNHFLQAVPYLDFTDKGLSNIAKRFNITVEELQNHIAEFQAKEGRHNG